MTNIYGININESRDKRFSEEGLSMLERYYSKDQSAQHALAKVVNNFSYGDVEMAQRLYDHASKGDWFPSSPPLANAVEGNWIAGVNYGDPEFWKEGNGEFRKSCWQGEQPKGMPISCFLTFLGDTIESQLKASAEIKVLSLAGGGTSLQSLIRAATDKAPGPVPFIKTVDGDMGYYKQGRTRRGACAVYVSVHHPDIKEFIQMRTPSGGDHNRKIINRAGVHHGVCFTRVFAEAVDKDDYYDLFCPHTMEVKERIKAREIWELFLSVREETGEPFAWFIDNVNEQMNEFQKRLGLKSNGSNLCTEISLPNNDERTAVCCLASLNLENFEEWKDSNLVKDLTKFLDNILQWFIDYAPTELNRAVFSATKERAIGIGGMGWANFLMKKNIPFEGGGFNSAVQWNHKIWSHIKSQAVEASKELAIIRGEPDDMKGSGMRNSHLLAPAPNANSSILCNTSPALEPLMKNAYSQKTRAGIMLVKNKYLEPVLEKYGLNTPEIWLKIIKDYDGSVQWIEQLSDHERNVFKTAFEIDQHWVIQHAEDRQVYICQAQSLNLFFLPGTDRGYINSVHLKALRSKVLKSLYYMRTGSAGNTDTVKTIHRQAMQDWKKQEDEGECVSCQA
jgi:ribonucleoside-diphosphate reductase alpha chain